MLFIGTRYKIANRQFQTFNLERSMQQPTVIFIIKVFNTIYTKEHQNMHESNGVSGHLLDK